MECIYSRRGEFLQGTRELGLAMAGGSGSIVKGGDGLMNVSNVAI